MNESNATKLLKLATVAERLDCSLRTVWQLIALGHLTPVRISVRATRVDAADLERFIDSRRRVSGTSR